MKLCTWKADFWDKQRSLLTDVVCGWRHENL